MRGLACPHTHVGCHVREDLRSCWSFSLQASAVRAGLSFPRVQLMVHSVAAPCGLAPLHFHLKVLPTVFVEFLATLGDTRVRWKISGHSRDGMTQGGFTPVQHQTGWLFLIILHCWFPSCEPEPQHPVFATPQTSVAMAGWWIGPSRLLAIFMAPLTIDCRTVLLTGVLTATCGTKLDRGYSPLDTTQACAQVCAQLRMEGSLTMAPLPVGQEEHHSHTATGGACSSLCGVALVPAFGQQPVTLAVETPVSWSGFHISISVLGSPFHSIFVLKGQRSYESCHSFLLMSLSLGRVAGARSSAARHCGGAQSTAAPPSAPLLPRARAGAQHDVVLQWYGTLGLSDTTHVKSRELSCGAHVARTARPA